MSRRLYMAENTNNNVLLSKLDAIDNQTIKAVDVNKKNGARKKYEEAVRSCARFNKKLDRKQNSLKAQRESYRTKIKKGSYGIIDTEHVLLKLNELKLSKVQKLNDIQLDNPDVKALSDEFYDLKLNKHDIVLPRLLNRDSVGRYKVNDEAFLNSLRSANDELKNKFASKEYKSEVLNKLKDGILSVFDKISETIVAGSKAAEKQVSSLIQANESIYKSISDIFAVEDIFTDLKEPKDLEKVRNYLNSYYEMVRKLQKNTDKIEQVCFNLRKDTYHKILKLIDAFDAEKFKLTPNFNMELVILSGNQTTLVRENDRFNSIIKVEKEIAERKEILRKVGLIEKYMEENNAHVLLTKKSIEAYDQFVVKYKVLKADVEIATIKAENAKYFYDLARRLEEKVNLDYTKAAERIAATYESIYEQTALDNQALKDPSKISEYKLDNKNTPEYLITTLPKYVQVVSQICTQCNLEDNLTIEHALTLTNVPNKQFKKLLSALCSREAIKEYNAACEKSKDLGEKLDAYLAYERKVAEYREKINTAVLDIEISEMKAKVTAKYTDKDVKHLKDEDEIRKRIAYLKENVHKDVKGKKIERAYNKLTRIQHYTNSDRDELVRKLDYIDLSHDNTLLEYEYDRKKVEEKVADQEAYISDVKVGGIQYADKMKELYKVKKAHSATFAKIDSKVKQARKEKLANDDLDLAFYVNQQTEAEEKLERYRQTFNKTRQLQASAVKTRKFSTKRTVGRRLRRAFVFIAGFLFLGLIEIIFPSWWLGAIIGLVCAIIVEILVYFASPINYFEFDQDNNIICYDKNGDETYFFKNSEIINYSIQVNPSVLGSIYNSTITLHVETGSDNYTFTYKDKVNKEFVINTLIEKELEKERQENPEMPDFMDAVSAK